MGSFGAINLSVAEISWRIESGPAYRGHQRSARQLRQFGDIRRDPSRAVAHERVMRRHYENFT